MSNIHPYILAIFAMVGFGSMIVPWHTTLQKMGSGQFFIIIGLVFVVVGIADSVVQNQDFSFAGDALVWGILTAMLYIGAMMALSGAIGSNYATLTVIAAIVAANPVVTVICEAVINKKLPTLQTAIMIAIIIAGVVGLSLSGKVEH